MADPTPEPAHFDGFVALLDDIEEGREVMAQVAAALDRRRGPLLYVAHRCSEPVAGGQLCQDCGIVLEDHTGKSYAIPDGQPDTGPPYWPTGSNVALFHRWGKPEQSGFRATLPDDWEPTETEGEYRCTKLPDDFGWWHR